MARRESKTLSRTLQNKKRSEPMMDPILILDDSASCGSSSSVEFVSLDSVAECSVSVSAHTQDLPEVSRLPILDTKWSRKEKSSSKQWYEDSDTDDSDEVKCHDLPRVNKTTAHTIRRGLSKTGASEKPDDDLLITSEGKPDVKLSVYSNRGQNVLSNFNSAKILNVIECNEDITHDLDPPTKTQSQKKKKSVITSANEPKKRCEQVNEMLGPPPPPSPSAKTKKKAYRLKRGVRKALRELSEAKYTKMNTSLTSDSDDVMVVDEEMNCEQIAVKILYISEVKKVSMKKWEPFSKVIPDIAKMFNIDENGVTLFFKDQSLSRSDTPNTINMNIVDIIECHVIQNGWIGEDDNDSLIPNKIELFVQCRNSKQREKVAMPKNRTLRYLMEKYAARKQLDLTKLQFLFDGDGINPTATPESLDMDDGDCIDVIMRT